MTKKIVLVTGGFDPLHSGHINYLESARAVGDLLLVGLNSDQWLVRKKGDYLLNYFERSTIITALHMVDEIIKYDDSDDTSINAIRKTRNLYPDSQIIFCNGGDRSKSNTPEYNYFNDDKNIIFKFNIGGCKTNSSSTILSRWKNGKNKIK